MKAARPERQRLIDQVLAFMRKNPGEFSARQVAEAIGAAPATVAAFLLSLTETKVLSRRMVGSPLERKYMYQAVRVLPNDVNPEWVVGWYHLPTWIKGDYQDDVRMHWLQSLTWAKIDEDKYHAYDYLGHFRGAWWLE